MKKNRQAYLPILLLFIIINSLIIAGRSFLERQGYDRELLIWANLLLFLITIIGFLLQRKGLQSINPNAFVRSVYASFMIKMFLVIIVTLGYVFIMKSKINKPGLFTAMGLYIVYTVVEVTALMKVAKKNKNA